MDFYLGTCAYGAAFSPQYFYLKTVMDGPDTGKSVFLCYFLYLVGLCALADMVKIGEAQQKKKKEAKNNGSIMFIPLQGICHRTKRGMVLNKTWYTYEQNGVVYKSLAERGVHPGGLLTK